jgi:hypothetical protein
MKEIFLKLLLGTMQFINVHNSNNSSKLFGVLMDSSKFGKLLLKIINIVD